MPEVRVNRRAGLLVLTALVAGAAPPLAGQQLSLQDAISIAQRQGHQARAAQATRDAARYRDRAFYSRLLPQLSLSGTLPQYNRSIIPIQQDSGGTVFLPLTRTDAQLSMRLSQRIPVTGGDLFVSSSLARLSLTGQQSSETWSSTPFTIGLRQDILRPNTTGWDRREQDVRSERDERSYLEAMEDVAIQVTDLFFNVYAARVALGNATTNAAVNDTLYRLNTGRYQVGRIGENDLLQSQLALLRSRVSFEGAQLEYERAVAALRIALDLPPGESLAVVVAKDVPSYDSDSAVAAAQALHNRAAVSDVELQQVQARRRVSEARFASGVGASLQASYGYNASASQARQAYQDLREARSFTLSVEIPLWQWGARGEGVRAALADRDRVASQTEVQLLQVAHDARFAALELTQSRRNVDLLATADTVAQRRFEVAYNRYVIGRITIDNLYIAQNEKDQALTQFVEGLRRYWRAHYRLRRLTLYDFEAGRPIR